MVKKKVTTKDRIVERLLNSRAIDATIREVSHNKDTSYREAFPNQWYRSTGIAVNELSFQTDR
jgi:UV-stimulated scaffold protein A